MNIVILRREELAEDGSVFLSGRRAEHIVDVLKGKPRQSVRIGVLDGPLGAGVIEGITAADVRLRCSFNEAPRPETSIDLILAMPRPKVMKRLWAPLASLGVRRIFLTNAARVERNYFDTHWIRPEHFEPLLVEGLEQAGDTRLPGVTVIRQLKPFIEDRMDALFPSGTRVVAHPSPERNTRNSLRCSAPVVLALGPEGGWTPYEIDMFDRNGFFRMSLGPRTLRTDTACIASISVLTLLIHENEHE